MGTDTNLRLSYPSTPSYLTSWVAQQQQQEVSQSFLWQQHHQHHNQWPKTNQQNHHMRNVNQTSVNSVSGQVPTSSRRIMSGI